jgi:formamidopyrimidine-DNA glycosylase
VPELPEVETVRRQLAERLPGRALARVEVHDALLVAPEAPEAFVAGVTGRRVRDVRRRGKYLLWGLDSGDTLALHLRMTGQLWWSPGPPDPGLTHVRARSTGLSLVPAMALIGPVHRGSECRERVRVGVRRFGVRQGRTSR